MPLNLQIETLIFSFIFGILFSFLLTVNHKIIYNSNKIIKIIGTILIVAFSNIVYFVGLKHIDNAAFHPYMLIALITGFYIETFALKLIKNKYVK